MPENSPIILGFVDNLMFTSRIESVVDGLGFQIEWMPAPRDVNQLPMDRIKLLSPALILVDLEMGNIPWEAGIKQIKSDSSTKAVPILCFGSHKDVDAISKAKHAGADKVVARSRFFSSMSDLFQALLM